MLQKTRRASRLAHSVVLRSIVLLSCGLAAACGGKDPTGNTSDPPQISAVSPDPLVEGQTAVLTGSNFASNTASNTVTLDNATLLVTAASTTSLTVTVPEGCGPLRIASLRVTVAGVASDPFSATVAPDPSGDAIENVSLSVGQQVVYRKPRHCLGLPTNGGAAQYLVGIQSTGRDGNVTNEVTVQGSTFGATLTEPAKQAAAGVAQQAPRRRSPPLRDLAGSKAFDLLQGHREGHNARLAGLVRPVRDPAVRPGALSAQRAPARVVVTGNEVIGDRLDLRVRDLGGDDCSAASTDTVTAELRAKTAGSMWWVDVDNPPGGFLDSDLEDMGTFFDDVIWASQVTEFGDAGDLDGNSRVAILVTQVLNADTSSAGQLLGFVNPCDFFPRDDATELVASNEGEFFYALAPDPTGAAGDTVATADLLELLPIIIAHEYAHIVQFSRRFASPTAQDVMALFVAEGQATLAEEIVGHTVLGNGTGQNLSADVAFDFSQTQVYPWYIAPFVDLAFYFGFPGSSSDPRIGGTPQQCTWIDDEVEHPCGGRPLWYGVTWSFLRWASDVYFAAPGEEPAFQKALIDGDLSGFDNLEEALAGLGQGTLEDHLARWAATLYMDGRPGASPENSMSSWNLLDVQQEIVEAAWLHPTEHGFTEFTETVTVRDPSTAFFLIGGFGASSHTLRVAGASGSDLGPNVQVWLVRTR